MDIDPKKPIILTFVGMPGSGKDSCTDYVAQKYNVPVLHFGHMVYEEVKKRGLDIVLDERNVREDMRAKEGLAVLAKRVAAKAREHIAQGQNRIALNGLYSWSEYKYLSEEFGNQFVCVAITVPRRLRYERIVNRKDAHRPYTLQQVLMREVEEIEHLEKGGPIARADYFLDNSKDRDAMFTQLDKLLDDIQF